MFGIGCYMIVKYVGLSFPVPQAQLFSQFSIFGDLKVYSGCQKKRALCAILNEWFEIILLETKNVPF